VVAIIITISTVVGVEPAEEAVVIRGARRLIPVLILNYTHPGDVVQDRQMGMYDLVLPEDPDAPLMR
jgi:hypothetical protein